MNTRKGYTGAATKYKKRKITKLPYKKRYIHTTLARELKWKDTTLNTACPILTQNFVVVSLVNMVNGSAVQQILGDECILKSVTVKLVFTTQATTTGGIVRVVLFQSLDAQASTNYFETANSVTSLANMANRKKFRVLADQVQYIGQTVATQSIAPNQVCFKIYKKIPPKYAKATYSAGTVAKNDIGIAYVSSCGVAALGTLGTARVRYVDA